MRSPDEPDLTAGVGTVQIRVVRPLTVPWVVEHDMVGSSWDIRAGAVPGQLKIPGETNGNVLEAPPGFGRVNNALGNGWGSSESGNGVDRQWRINAIGFEFVVMPASTPDPQTFSKNSIEDPFNGEINAWLQRFGAWTRAWLGQLLDPMHPSPALLNPPNSRQFLWATLETAECQVNTSPGRIAMESSDDNDVLAELSISRTYMQRLVGHANDPSIKIPPALEFLALGRQAAQRRILRQSIVDLGTAAEALLRSQLKFDPTNGTLGTLVKEAHKHAAGLLPVDTQQLLVDPRNDAVHRGESPSLTEVKGATEIVQRLLDNVLPDWARPADARRAHRAQRLDWVVIVPSDG